MGGKLVHLAQQILSEVGVSIKSYVSSVGSVRLNKSYKSIDFSKIDENIVRCPDTSIAKKMIEEVEKTKKEEILLVEKLHVLLKEYLLVGESFCF